MISHLLTSDSRLYHGRQINGLQIDSGRGLPVISTAAATPYVAKEYTIMGVATA